MILRLAIFVLLASATATTWTIVNGVNANPKGNNPPTVKNLADCEAKAEGHTQFTYNLRSGHCFVGDGTTFSGAALDHVKSGCDATRVTAGCEAPVPPAAQTAAHSLLPFRRRRCTRATMIKTSTSRGRVMVE